MLQSLFSIRDTLSRPLKKGLAPNWQVKSLQRTMGVRCLSPFFNRLLGTGIRVGAMMAEAADYLAVCEEAVRIGGAVVQEWVGGLTYARKAVPIW